MAAHPTTTVHSTTSRRAVLGALGLCGAVGIGYALGRTGMDSYDVTPPEPETGDWRSPPASADWQWQLSGPIETGYDVALYDLDGCLAEQAYEYDEVDAYAPFLNAGKWLGVCEYRGPLDCADARKRGLHLIRKQPRLGSGRPASCG